MVIWDFDENKNYIKVGNYKVLNLKDADKASKLLNDIDTLILSGGSIKGISQLGALHCLLEHKIIDICKNFPLRLVNKDISNLIYIDESYQINRINLFDNSFRHNP